MLAFIAQHLAASIVGMASIIVALFTITFSFLKVDPIYVSRKTGLKILAGICFAVFFVTAGYLAVQYITGEESIELPEVESLAPSEEIPTESETAETGAPEITTTPSPSPTTGTETTAPGQSGSSTTPTGVTSEPARPVTVAQVTLSQSQLTLAVNEQAQLQVSVLYSDNTQGSTVVWTSSNEKIAMVDESGNITALAPGSATITAQASRNNHAKLASCTVTVSGIPTGYDISLSTDRTTLGATFTIYVEPYEDDITEIRIFAQSPSGHVDSYLLSEDGRYYIDTELGVWTIYASVTNAAGTYEAQRAEDYVTIEITDPMEQLEDVLQGLGNS